MVGRAGQLGRYHYIRKAQPGSQAVINTRCWAQPASQAVINTRWWVPMSSKIVMNDRHICLVGTPPPSAPGDFDSPSALKKYLKPLNSNSILVPIIITQL